MAPQGFFGSPLDANVVAPVRVRGEFVRTDLYAASWARPIASLGAGLITTIIAAGLFGSAAPIGTHVFTAMARNDAGLRWTAVTIDNGDDAKDALDRISIPKEVLDRIAPTALPRSSIIVSDEPLSRETNYRTEFIAVLSNQPQGGFIRRRPTISFPPASSKSWNGGGFFSFFDAPSPSPRRRGRNYQVQRGWWE